tara:strand:+ start:889 stop:1674 length:786 start_codon:yes stop_codon:yes gene_type:complete
MDYKHYDKINHFGYIPVGLGDKINSDKFLTDKKGENISEKNPFYGEYTFHYWLWKNELHRITDEWIGFCQYRKFWVTENHSKKIYNLEDLNKILIKDIPKNFGKFDCILGDPIFINQFRFSKFIKNNFKTMIKNPSLFFNKNKRNLKFHFDMMHGKGNLDKAILLLEKNDRDEFKDFVNTEVSFNPHNMFICKSSRTLDEFYNTIFPWLKRCEKKFGFGLEGYGLKRIYGFLAERFMPFWFKKYTNYKTMPLLFKDISELD